jgi:hypothetical protein
MSSPLGRYASLVAALVAVAIIGVDLGLHVLGRAPDIFIDNLAFAAFGAIFGASASSAATNGTIGRDLQALHARLDAATIAPATPGPTP